jgi:DNA-binding transcriptional LysR family regulator
MRKVCSGVEPRHLAALAAVAEQGTFRGAADSLGYVQSAVSQQIAQLERLVDLRLVERRRGPGRVQLTAAGVLLLAHAENILDRFEAATADLDRLREGRAGVVRLGVSETVATRLLPRFIAGFRRAAPEFALEIGETAAEADLWRKVQAGQVDAGFCGLPQAAGPLECAAVLRDPFVLVVAADSATAAAVPPLEPRQLSRLPLIEHCLMRHVEEQLGRLDFEPRYDVRSELYATVQALVGGGIGAAILPRLAVDEADAATQMLPLDDLLSPRAIGICWNPRRRLAPGLEALVETARTVGAAHRRDDGELRLAA